MCFRNGKTGQQSERFIHLFCFLSESGIDLVKYSAKCFFLSAKPLKLTLAVHSCEVLNLRHDRSNLVDLDFTARSGSNKAEISPYVYKCIFKRVTLKSWCGLCSLGYMYGQVTETFRGVGCHDLDSSCN